MSLVTWRPYRLAGEGLGPQLDEAARLDQHRLPGRRPEIAVFEGQACHSSPRRRRLQELAPVGADHHAEGWLFPHTRLHGPLR